MEVPAYTYDQWIQDGKPKEDYRHWQEDWLHGIADPKQVANHPINGLEPEVEPPPSIIPDQPVQTSLFSLFGKEETCK